MTTDMRSRLMGRDENEQSVQSCPSCEMGPVKSEQLRQEFSFGEGESAATLAADVILRTCSACGFQFFDEEAEEARHDAVCAHLGLLTPREIFELRKSTKLSRADFSRITKIGEATLARWERGELLQNAAYDQYLRLLAVGDNFARLRARANENADDRDRPIIVPITAKRTRVFRSGISAAGYSPAALSWTPRKAG